MKEIPKRLLQISEVLTGGTWKLEFLENSLLVMIAFKPYSIQNEEFQFETVNQAKKSISVLLDSLEFETRLWISETSPGKASIGVGAISDIGSKGLDLLKEEEWQDWCSQARTLKDEDTSAAREALLHMAEWRKHYSCDLVPEELHSELKEIDNYLHNANEVVDAFSSLFHKTKISGSEDITLENNEDKLCKCDHSVFCHTGSEHRNGACKAVGLDPADPCSCQKFDDGNEILNDSVNRTRVKNRTLADSYCTCGHSIFSHIDVRNTVTGPCQEILKLLDPEKRCSCRKFVSGLKHESWDKPSGPPIQNFGRKTVDFGSGQTCQCEHSISEHEVAGSGCYKNGVLLQDRCVYSFEDDIAEKQRHPAKTFCTCGHSICSHSGDRYDGPCRDTGSATDPSDPCCCQEFEDVAQDDQTCWCGHSMSRHTDSGYRSGSCCAIGSDLDKTAPCECEKFRSVRTKDIEISRFDTAQKRLKSLRSVISNAGYEVYSGKSLRVRIQKKDDDSIDRAISDILDISEKLPFLVRVWIDSWYIATPSEAILGVAVAKDSTELSHCNNEIAQFYELLDLLRGDDWWMEVDWDKKVVNLKSRIKQFGNSNIDSWESVQDALDHLDTLLQKLPFRTTVFSIRNDSEWEKITVFIDTTVHSNIQEKLRKIRSALSGTGFDLRNSDDSLRVWIPISNSKSLELWTTVIRNLLQKLPFETTLQTVSEPCGGSAAIGITVR